jgi:hypothetical protein
LQNFFSTQFVQTNEQGVMQVSRHAWLLAAIAIPLTVLTLFAWWLWAHGTIPLLLNRLLSFRHREQLADMEKGNISKQAMQAQGICPKVQLHQMCNSRVASSMTAVSCEKYTKI